MAVEWVPVVDVSRHQGLINFATMRAKGVGGLIIRISHGLVLDERAEVYWNDARAAGFAARDIGWYPFVNPKRSSATAAAAFAVENIARITGSRDFFYMLDVENYRNESPNPGTAPVYGAAFAAHIREHIATVRTMAPLSRVIGYTNRAYWNGKVAGTTSEWVGDDALAAELDWIVARYPAYSLAAYARRPLPPTVDGWAEWAFAAAPNGPYPPKGATWRAWQFSAGYNRQGPAYGASSSDLDLNIVHPDAWARWTTTPATPDPIPPGGDDMVVITNATAGKYGDALMSKFVLHDDGTKRLISPDEWIARGQPVGNPCPDNTLDVIPNYAPPAPGGGPTTFTGTGTSTITWTGQAT